LPEIVSPAIRRKDKGELADASGGSTDHIFARLRLFQSMPP
jgi:hypothetical protein